MAKRDADGRQFGVNHLITPMQRSSRVGNTRIHFGDVASHCEEFIAHSPELVGAVAWIRSPRLVSVMRTRPIAFVVNKEFALRKANSSERKKIAPLRGGVRGFSKPTEAVRVIGDRSRGSFTGLMHHKFLVRLDQSGLPIAVWNGSFNLTSGAEGNVENALEIHDPDVAVEFYVEFARLWEISEPLSFRDGAPAASSKPRAATILETIPEP